MPIRGQAVNIHSDDGAEQVYVSVFDKTDGHRLTSYTILGYVHGQTLEECEAKAEENFPDAYHVRQTESEWAAVLGGDLRYNGTGYEEPPTPTPEEQADADAQNEAYEAQSALAEIQTKATRAMLAGGPIATLQTAYQTTLASVSDAAALKMPEFYPEWDGDSHEYKVGDRVNYGGTLYKVLQAHTSQSTWTPTDAPSLFAKVLVTGDEDTPPEWEQPDSTNPYMKGDRVTYNGKVYESLVDNNVWSPENYPQGWQEVTDTNTDTDTKDKEEQDTTEA